MKEINLLIYLKLLARKQYCLSKLAQQGIRSSHQTNALAKNDLKLLPTFVKDIFRYATTVRHAVWPQYKNSERLLQGNNKRVNMVTF